MSKDYDFETATEGERWAYDQGIEAAHDPSRMDLDDIRDMLEVCVAALNRIIAEEKARPAYTGKIIPPIEDLHDSGDDL